MLEVPSEFFYETLEQHYLPVLSKAINEVLGEKAQLEYMIKSKKLPPPPSPIARAIRAELINDCKLAPWQADRLMKHAPSLKLRETLDRLLKDIQTGRVRDPSNPGGYCAAVLEDTFQCGILQANNSM